MGEENGGKIASSGGESLRHPAVGGMVIERIKILVSGE